ncbi:MAG: hypothetical protein K0Q74_1677, partial [Gammaproteobacteria bacterium]|nr:hypothetical protein [Gammaproteobacteria bacterium]
VVVKHYHQQIALISLAKESQGPQEFAKFLLTLTCLFMFSEESAHAKTPDDILHWLDTPRNLMLPKGIRYTGEKISLVGKGKATCSDLVYRSGYRCKVQGTPEQADDNDEETILYAFKTPGHPGPLPEFGFRNATPDQAQGFQKAIYDARSMNTWYDYPSAPPEPRLTPETVSTYQDPKQRYTHVDFAFEPTPATVNPEIHILRTRVTELEQENANLKAKYEASQAENIQLRSENTETKNEMAGLIEASERRMAENNAEHARQMEERIRQVTAESTESARQDREASEQRLRERDTEHLGKIQQITEENARQVKESAEQAEKQTRQHAQQMQEIMKLMEIMTKKKPDQSSEEENNAASGGRSSEAAAAENTTPLPCRR